MTHSFGYLKDFFSTTGKTLARKQDGGYTLTRFDGGYPVSQPIEVWTFSTLQAANDHARRFGA